MRSGSFGRALGPNIRGFSSPDSRQHGVADRLALQPPPAGVPEQVIVAVGVQRLRACGRSVGVDPRILAVRGRQHHQPVHVLEAPAVLHELHRQPVEQFRVRRRARPDAEVARRGDDARRRNGAATAD